jgi:protein-disulfide isomerase
MKKATGFVLIGATVVGGFLAGRALRDGGDDDTAGTPGLAIPGGERKKIPLSGEVKGANDALVTIIEFSDFQCPFCRQVQPALAELQARYGDKIRWSFKDLPLSSIHPQAQGAAEAARCAADQGKFWEFRAAMFAASSITPELFQTTADGLGVNSDEFKTCVASGRHREAVLADSEEAEGLGISGTPAFVINGVLLSGAQPLENFVSVIDRELARAKP